MERDEWVEVVNRLMLRDWCIDTADAGLSRVELTKLWRDGEQPEALVDRWAEKYDLIWFELRRA